MKLIWTAKALDHFWANDGVRDPMHTISAPNIEDTYDGFVRQLRRGVPWVLATDDGHPVDQGTAPGRGAL